MEGHGPGLIHDLSGPMALPHRPCSPQLAGQQTGLAIPLCDPGGEECGKAATPHAPRTPANKDSETCTLGLATTPPPETTALLRDPQQWGHELVCTLSCQVAGLWGHGESQAWRWGPGGGCALWRGGGGGHVPAGNSPTEADPGALRKLPTPWSLPPNFRLHHSIHRGHSP